MDIYVFYSVLLHERWSQLYSQNLFDSHRETQKKIISLCFERLNLFLIMFLYEWACLWGKYAPVNTDVCKVKKSWIRGNWEISYLNLRTKFYSSARVLFKRVLTHFQPRVYPFLKELIQRKYLMILKYSIEKIGTFLRLPSFVKLTRR